LTPVSLIRASIGSLFSKKSVSVVRGFATPKKRVEAGAAQIGVDQQDAGSVAGQVLGNAADPARHGLPGC